MVLKFLRSTRALGYKCENNNFSICYFWVKQLVDGKAAVVRHLATELMHANVMTKAVQGKQFIDERDRLTNWPTSQVATSEGRFG